MPKLTQLQKVRRNSRLLFIDFVVEVFQRERYPERFAASLG